MATKKLEAYRAKRDFTQTSEPSGETAVAPAPRLRFVIQKHAATRLHYDLRLELDGVFKSWAVTKGPSIDPHDRRLAVEVEDHPLDYGDFEGIIPEGEYGGGTVMLWDRGTYEADVPDVGRALRAGELRFTLRGRKLKGGWVLVRTGGRKWLLMKRKDASASASVDITTAKPRSVKSRRLLAGIARDAGGNVERAATGDP